MRICNDCRGMGNHTFILPKQLDCDIDWSCNKETDAWWPVASRDAPRRSIYLGMNV